MRTARQRLIAAISVLLALFALPMLCAAEGAGAEVSSQGMVVALQGCALIDGTGAPPIADAVILVRDGRILDAGPASSARIPKGAKVVKLKGATALPGIINAHVHAAFDEARLKEWAAAGVTSVRDMASFGESIEEVMRWREESRERPELARLFVVGPMISAPGGYGSLFVSSEKEAREQVAALAAAGVDAIKTSLEDGYAGRYGLPKLSDAEIVALRDAAHAAGKRLTMHITEGEYLERAVKLGVDELAHVAYDRVSDGVLEEAARKGITLIPTFTVFRNYGAPVNICVQNLKKFVEAGGRVVLGNDYAGGPGDFESGVPLFEMNMMSHAGMSSMDIIVASTRDAAFSCGAQDYLGTIEKGKLADILVVKGDPLKDLGALKSPLLVMKEGAVIVGQR